ncbi:MAG: peptide-methionine (S)-S-oxide reductase MsrA [Deltaproteobacteria bacterium]|nr:peptide-methionine (S)-S-oxide reductase MsrA [Deltaproteobacteria bacterium]
MAGTEIAVLAGGCFWCLEAAFQTLRGVAEVRPGYTGGDASEPSYEEVCTGRTGHAEAVEVRFDPGVISYRELLEVFFALHDPTTPNRQGADVGTQYRSAIFYGSEAQRRTAEEVVAELEREGLWDAPIVTELAPLGPFFEAEPYHRDYYRRNASQGYCRIVIEPKLRKLRARFLEKLKEG